MSLVSIIPYAMTPDKDIKSLVIGLGTGISAGVLASLDRVSQVDVFEISRGVIKAAEFMSPENLDFHKSPKTRIYQSDAFQMLKALDKKYNMIISEPPNPWVVGSRKSLHPLFL